MVKQQDVHLLLLRISKGDERAFLMFYDMYWEQLYVYAVRILKDKTTAEDVIQEVFIKIWNIREHLMSVRDLNPYLITITKNLSIKAILKSNRLQSDLNSFISVFESKERSIEEVFDAKELSRLIDFQVDELPDKMKEIFLLSRQKGFSNKDIAESLNISEHTVKKQINNSIKRIRTRIRYFF